jgi:hypothetical protein
MNRMRPVAALGAVAVLALTPSAALAGPGQDQGRHLGNDVLRSSLTPAVPTDAPINGVKPGGLPWVVASSEVRLRVSGRLDVRIEGLQVSRPDGSTDNPVGSVDALVFCGPTKVADTGPQPLTVPDGDLERRTVVSLPSTCTDPSGLISPTASAGGAYIASAIG